VSASWSKSGVAGTGTHGSSLVDLVMGSSSYANLGIALSGLG
jgi:hypothetical protein